MNTFTTAELAEAAWQAANIVRSGEAPLEAIRSLIVVEHLATTDALRRLCAESLTVACLSGHGELVYDTQREFAHARLAV